MTEDLVVVQPDDDGFSLAGLDIEDVIPVTMVAIAEYISTHDFLDTHDVPKSLDDRRMTLQERIEWLLQQ